MTKGVRAGSVSDSALLALLLIVGCEKPASAPAPVVQAEPFRFEVSRFSQIVPKRWIDDFQADREGVHPEVCVVERSVQLPSGVTKHSLEAEIPYSAKKIDTLLRRLKADLVDLSLETGANLPIPVEVTIEDGRWTGFVMRYQEATFEGTIEVKSTKLTLDEKNRCRIEMSLSEKPQR